MDNSDERSSSFEEDYRPANGAVAIPLNLNTLPPILERGENQILLKFRNAQRDDKDMFVDLDSTVDEVKGDYIKLLNDYSVHSGLIRFIA